MTLHVKDAPASNVSVAKTKGNDFRGECYPEHKLDNISLVTKAFTGEVQYQEVKTREELKAVLTYGQYLEHQGYSGTMVGDFDHLGVKLLWLGESESPRAQRTFGVLVSRTLLDDWSVSDFLTFVVTGNDALAERVRSQFYHTLHGTKA